MNFELTDTQKMVRETVRQFAEERLKPGAHQRDKDMTPALAEIKEFGKLGFYGCSIPEEFGGSPLDAISEAIIIEELSRVDASFGVFFAVQVGIGCLPIVKWGSEQQKKKYLPRVATGELLTAYALTEPGAGSDAANISSTAEKKNGYYVLNGQKVFCTNGSIAGLYIIMAKTDPSAGHRGISAFIVERDFPGLIIGKKEIKLGLRSSDTVELYLQNLEVPAENLLGQEGMGFKIALDALNDSRIGIAAQATGIAQGAMEETIKYVSEREQYDRKIGSFELVYNVIAEMRARVDSARFLTYYAAWLREQNRPHAVEASIAKLVASENAHFVCDKAVQLHGGYGYISDFPVERFYRDVKVTEIYEGTNEIQRLVIARGILPKEVFEEKQKAGVRTT